MQTSVLQFPTPPAKQRELYLDPECPFHYSEKPFTPGQASTAHVLQPAQQFAAVITRRMYAGLKNPDSSVTISEDVMRGYLAAAYNAGYAAALDAEFAAEFAENDPELGTR